MSEDFASSNLIPEMLCEAVEEQKRGEREQDKEGRAGEKDKR